MFSSFVFFFVDTVYNAAFFFRSVLHWSVAVSTICHQSSRVVSGLSQRSREAEVKWAQVYLSCTEPSFY